MDVHGVLRWQDPLAGEAILVSFHEAVLEAILDGPGKLSPIFGEWQCISDRIRNMPFHAVARLITAPETYTRTVQAVQGDYRSLAKFLNSSIEIELIKSHIATGIHRSGWSALGDYFVPQNQSSDVSNSCRWVPDMIYESPKILDTIALDFFSPRAQRDLPVAKFRPVTFGPYETYAEHEVLLITEKIDRASQKLRDISTSVSEFVRRFTRTIIPRKDSSNLDFSTSSSCNAYIGRIVLINPHLDRMDESALVDALVHESIHSLLWRTELLVPFIENPSLIQGTTRSPWTGSELHLYTFLQACFVWFGLLNFWKEPNAQRVFGTKLATKYFERAQRGFLDEGVTKNVTAFQDALRPGLFTQLEDMQREAADLRQYGGCD